MYSVTFAEIHKGISFWTWSFVIVLHQEDTGAAGNDSNNKEEISVND